jgi:hypothetical protein
VEAVIIILAVNSGVLVSLVVYVAKLSYEAGKINQRVIDQSEELKRMRDRLDKFIDSQKYREE